MAFSRLLTLLLVVTLSVNALSQTWTGDHLLCLKTPNKALCFSILRADPRSRGADIYVLNEIFIEKAEEGANATARLADSLARKLANSSHDQELFSRLSSCASHYGLALGLYKLVHEFLNSKMYYLAHARAIAAQHEGEVCVGNFDNPPPPPAEFTKATKLQQDLGAIVLVFSNHY